MIDRSIGGEDWRSRRDAYLARMRPLADDRVRRVGRQRKHPVYDFLFEYYSYRPSYLMRWSPGVGVRLEGAAEWDQPAFLDALRGLAGAETGAT